MDNPLRLREYKEKDLDLITIIGGVYSMAVENAELFKEQERIIQELRTAKEHLEKAQQNRLEKEKNINEIAFELGLGKFAFRKKRAAQYGSRFDKAIERLAKKNGFKFKRDYLNSL